MARRSFYRSSNRSYNRFAKFSRPDNRPAHLKALEAECERLQAIVNDGGNLGNDAELVKARAAYATALEQWRQNVALEAMSMAACGDF